MLFSNIKAPVEDISLLFDIDMAGDKVIMAPIISEVPCYEENQLKKYRDLSCMFCNLSHEKRLYPTPTTTCPETKFDFHLM
jgi:hypothetical protein